MVTSTSISGMYLESGKCYVCNMVTEKCYVVEEQSYMSEYRSVQVRFSVGFGVTDF